MWPTASNKAAGGRGAGGPDGGGRWDGGGSMGVLGSAGGHGDRTLAGTAAVAAGVDVVALD